ncbi:MFS transporter [Streptomyces oryzae]|uniref:MFS transporter n=1 Tax=Streptomyces oryzae TaxID=1434886 RepID=A0ABS3XFB0_9ACTN|nr:MFS transporter [Streptomyces oryzae]MBO8194050.1 MFS transporter [Streptomyces oryzae]
MSVRAGTAEGLEDPYDALGRARRRLVTLALLGCAFLAMLDGTVVGTALPRIVEQTGGGESWYVWLVTAYLLTSSVSVPVYGRFSDLYGRRRLLLGGLGFFLAGSLACGLAGTTAALIAARAVQGLGAGALLTLGMALIRDLYPPERGAGLVRMQTVLAAMMVLGLVGGPLVGGLLTDHADWRWAFWLNLPLGLAAALVIGCALPERRPSAGPTGSPVAGGPRRARVPGGARLDVLGILLLSAGLSLVLVGLSLKGNAAGEQAVRWTDPVVAGPLAGGAALLALLLPVERRARTPVLPLRLFGHRSYGALLGAGFFFQIAALPVGILLPLYFQQVRGQSATVSGLLLLPLLIGMTVGNRVTAVAVLRSGRTKPVLLAGAGLLALGSGSFFALGDGTSAVWIGLWLLLAGLGTGPAMGGLTIATQNSVPRADMGTATAGSALTKQLGGAVGLAVAQTLLAQYGGHHAPGSHSPDGPGGLHGGGLMPDASAIGLTVGWTGVVGGLLALAVLWVMPDVGVPKPGAEKRVAGDGRPAAGLAGKAQGRGGGPSDGAVGRGEDGGG